jgi:hypothetical protein
MRWIKARNSKNELVKVRQCAKHSAMFVSDNEDYYNVTDLDFTTMEEVEGVQNSQMPMFGSFFDTSAYEKSMDRLKKDNERKHYMELRGQVLSFLLANHNYKDYRDVLEQVRYIIEEIKRQDGTKD